MNAVGKLVAAVVLVVLGAGCRSGKGVRCADRECDIGQVCHQPTLLCVRDEPPVLTLTSPAADAVVTGGELQLAGSVKDDAEVKSVEYSADDGASWSAITLGSDGSFSVTVAVPALDSAPFKLSVRARDSFEQSSQAAVSATVDNVAPTCAVTSPEPGKPIAAALPTAISLRFHAEDGSGVLMRPQAWVDDAELGAPVTMGSDFTFEWAAATAVPSHAIKFAVTDKHGHPCSVSQTVALDTSVPTLTVTSPVEGALLGPSAGTTVTFTGLALDGAVPAASVTVDFGDEVGPRPAAIGGNGEWLVKLSPSNKDDSVVHAVKVTAKDLAGNQTIKTVNVTVDYVPPRVTLTAPLPGEAFNIAKTPADGKLQVKWAAVDGDTQLRFESVNGDGSTTTVSGGATFLQTAATDDGKSYTVKIRAFDRAGNVGMDERSVVVDRVAPTFTVNHTNNARNEPAIVSAHFSEPLANSAGPFALTPSLPGNWKSSLDYEINLENDSVYTLATVTTGPTDLRGNPLASSSIRFATVPKTPVSGVIKTGKDLVYDVATDPDGFPTLAVAVVDPPPGPGPSVLSVTYSLLRFNGRTGMFDTLKTAQDSVWMSNLAAVSWRNLKPDLTTERVSGVSARLLSGTKLTLTAINGVAGSQNVDLFVPVPPSPREQNLQNYPVGVILNGTYSRPGQLPEPINFTPDVGIFTSPDEWLLARVDAGTLKLKGRSCGTLGCEWSTEDSVATGTPPLNLSIVQTATTGSTGHHVVYTLDASSTVRRESCLSVNTPQTASTDWPLDSHLSIAKQSDSKLIGARWTSGGLQLVERPLSPACTGGFAWVPIATVPNTASLPHAANIRAVAVGAKGGVLYVDASNNLMLYVVP